MRPEKEGEGEGEGRGGGGQRTKHDELCPSKSQMLQGTVSIPMLNTSVLSGCKITLSKHLHTHMYTTCNCEDILTHNYIIVKVKLNVWHLPLLPCLYSYTVYLFSCGIVMCFVSVQDT